MDKDLSNIPFEDRSPEEQERLQQEVLRKSEAYKGHEMHTGVPLHSNLSKDKRTRYISKINTKNMERFYYTGELALDKQWSSKPEDAMVSYLLTPQSRYFSVEENWAVEYHEIDLSILD